MCMCVCVSERERQSVCASERERERESVCVCVRVRERVVVVVWCGGPLVLFWISYLAKSQLLPIVWQCYVNCNYNFNGRSTWFRDAASPNGSNYGTAVIGNHSVDFIKRYACCVGLVLCCVRGAATLPDLPTAAAGVCSGTCALACALTRVLTCVLTRVLWRVPRVRLVCWPASFIRKGHGGQLALLCVCGVTRPARPVGAPGSKTGRGDFVDFVNFTARTYVPCGPSSTRGEANKIDVAATHSTAKVNGS